MFRTPCSAFSSSWLESARQARPEIAATVAGETPTGDTGTMEAVCVECGLPLPGTGECWTRVHELLEIESRVLVHRDPETGMRAHYFAIAAYLLQHPSRSTQPALDGLLDDVTSMLHKPRPMCELRETVRRRHRGVNVSRIATPDDRAHVASQWPTQWSITASDVIASAEDGYVESVQEWAAATVAQLGVTRASRTSKQPHEQSGSG